MTYAGGQYVFANSATIFPGGINIPASVWGSVGYTAAGGLGYILAKNGWNGDTTEGGGPADWGADSYSDSRPDPIISYNLMPVQYRMEYQLFVGPGAAEPRRVMEVARDALLINAGQWAAEWYADQYTHTGNPLYAVGGGFASLWTPSTAGKTALTLGTGYASAGWAASTKPWLGALEYHSAHGVAHGGRAHLQFMLRAGRSGTKHWRLLFPWK